jgi:hypothetical protein
MMCQYVSKWMGCRNVEGNHITSLNKIVTHMLGFGKIAHLNISPNLLSYLCHIFDLDCKLPRVVVVVNVARYRSDK